MSIFQYGPTVKKIRERRKLSPLAVSKAIGKDAFWMSRIESGAEKLTTEDVLPITQILCCTVDEIFFPLPDKKSPGS